MGVINTYSRNPANTHVVQLSAMDASALTTTAVYMGGAAVKTTNMAVVPGTAVALVSTVGNLTTKEVAFTVTTKTELRTSMGDRPLNPSDSRSPD